MKLYATVTSERASKGQGGNDFVQIEVKNAAQETIGIVDFFPNNTARISIRRDIDADIDTMQDALPYKEKGEKQKGECEEGGNHFTAREGDEEICRKCLRTI